MYINVLCLSPQSRYRIPQMSLVPFIADSSPDPSLWQPMICLQSFLEHHINGISIQSFESGSFHLIQCIHNACLLSFIYIVHSFLLLSIKDLNIAETNNSYPHLIGNTLPGYWEYHLLHLNSLPSRWHNCLGDGGGEGDWKPGLPLRFTNTSLMHFQTNFVVTAGMD